MDGTEDYFWLLAVAGGAMLLGAALAYGVLKQKPLSASEQDRQDARVAASTVMAATPAEAGAVTGRIAALADSTACSRGYIHCSWLRLWLLCR